LRTFRDNPGLSCWLRATQRPCGVSSRSRDIYGHVCHAQSRGGSSAIGNCQSRVPQYSRPSSRPTPTKVDYQVACGGLKSIIKSPAAPYSRLSGRLRRPIVDFRVACGGLESTIRSSVPATGRLRRQSTQNRLIKSRSHGAVRRAWALRTRTRMLHRQMVRIYRLSG
jgi:hypothetical protein